MANERVYLQKYRDKDFIFVQAVKRPTPYTMQEAAGAVAELIKKHNCKKILVDTGTIEQPYNEFDMFRFGQEITSEDIFQGTRIAHVSSRITDEMTDFFSAVSINRGFEVRAFSNIADAKWWLFS
jgi:hypothetical protein